MNWTGGTLQRTKRANKGVVQKQRAYFARARTKLQQSPVTPTVPFRPDFPDFLHEGVEPGIGRCVSSFASGPLRQSTKKRHERDKHLTPPAAQRNRGDSARTEIRNSRSRFEDICIEGKGRAKQQQTSRKRTTTDNEIQLLEANKRRLLQQQNWVGVVHPHTADLQYSSPKERTPFSKRRNHVSKSRQATIRSPVTFRHRSGQAKFGDRYDALMSGALPPLAAADNIRIRIGSDVLTTAASNQSINHPSSQTNSDSMLFDEEVDDTVGGKASENLGEPSSGHRVTAGLESTDRWPAKLAGNYPFQLDSPKWQSLVRGLDRHADERTRHTTADSDALGQTDLQSEAIDPSFRLTHHVGGIEHPLRLTFGGQSTGRVKRTASPTDETGDMQPVHANDCEVRYATRDVEVAQQTGARRSLDPFPIDDSEPWRPYLDTGISSPSRGRMHDWTGTSAPQPHIFARKTRADSTNRSQHNTQANLTHANLLTVSASVPALTRPSARLIEARPLARAEAAKEFGKDEAFWRYCAFGCDPQSASETIHTYDETSEDLTSQATKGYASTRLPLSATVNSVSPTPSSLPPFRPRSEQASCISDDVQRAPRSGSRSIISAAPSHAVWDGVLSPDVLPVPRDKLGDETYAGSQFGEQSTHASMQNHASHTTDMSSGTRTSLGALDLRKCARDNVSRRAQASGSSVGQRHGTSSMRDIASSDGAGIDLVDVDRWP